MQEKAKLVKIGEQFEVVLPSNPTTGYQWYESLDKSILTLVEKSFRPGSDKIGSGGLQIFIFNAIARGETSIYLQYKRPWESIPVKEETVTVKIE